MNSEKRLQVVLGGTSGMGFAVAKALGKYGSVLIGGRSEKKLKESIDALKASGVEVYGKSVDVSDRTSVENFAEYAKTLAPLGNVINAAGVDAGGGEKILKINVMGTINVTEVFLPLMQPGCKQVNFSSITGYFYLPTPEDIAVWSDPNASDFFEKAFKLLDAKECLPRMEHLGKDYVFYTASKSFVIYYTKANAARFGAKDCCIFSIAPGTFDTPMFREQTNEQYFESYKKLIALNRFGSPEEMATFIAHLLNPDIQYLTGCDLILDGGMSAIALAKQL